MAQKVCEFLMQDSAEGSMGESVGWLAGTIAFEVVLGILTAGSWTAASGAMKVLKGFARILDWTGEALGVAFKALSRVGGFLLEAIQGLGRLVGNMGGAVRGILDALQEIGEKLIRFGEELLGLAGRKAGGEAVEEIAEETAEQSGRHGDSLVPPTRTGAETPTTRAPNSDPSLTPEHQELLGSSATKRGDQLTPNELNAELEIAGNSPRKPLNDGRYTEEIELPNNHEWRHRKDGAWCRFSDEPTCISGDELGELLGEGGNKKVYALGDEQAVGILKTGKNPQLLDEELDLLSTLDELGLPTVNAKPIQVDGKPALVFDRFAQGSKEAVRLDRGKIRVVGESSLLNQRSIEDLTRIRDIMQRDKIKINDLQFLIGDDGRVVIADPLAVIQGEAPSKNNISMINKLIDLARRNLER